MRSFSDPVELNMFDLVSRKKQQQLHKLRERKKEGTDATQIEPTSEQSERLNRPRVIGRQPELRVVTIPSPECASR